MHACCSPEVPSQCWCDPPCPCLPAGCRAVLELHVQSSANHHYHNLATFLGSGYQSVEWIGGLAVPLLLDKLTQLMDVIDAAGDVCAQQMGVVA